jgi:hypothetical protein
MFGPEYAALCEEREALARERMDLRDELMRRKDLADKAEGEMWRTLSLPGGTEPYQAWKAALASLDDIHETIKAAYRKQEELSARMRAWHAADWAKMDAEAAAAGRLQA